MPNLNIAPLTVLLSPGSAVTFHATTADAGNNIVASNVNWTAPPTGMLYVGGVQVPPGAASDPASSATFMSPTVIAAGQNIALIASSGADSASATIALTPNVVSVIPAEATLNAGKSQTFTALVGAPEDPADPVVWILNPEVGTLNQSGLYNAPADIPDSMTVIVTAARKGLGKQASGKVNLTSPPWHGTGVDLLGAYLLLVFCVVFAMIRLWPPTTLTPETASANYLQAQTTLQAKVKDLQSAAAALAQPSGTNSTTTSTSATLQAAQTAFGQAKKAEQAAETDVDRTYSDEKAANNPCVSFKLFGRIWSITREVDLLLLVLLAGCLGSFLHTVQSFSAFVGNRTIKKSWAWWYAVNPFIGAALAFVFYAALRGGVMTATTAINVKSTDLNAFGLVAIGCIVGMFSKAATQKLGEVFDTLFQSNKAAEQKDKMTNTSTAGQAGAGPSGGASGSATGKQ
jgi:hypothetical protein